VVRLYLLNAHYRTQLDFRRELVDQTKGALERMRNTVSNLQHNVRSASVKQITPGEAELLGELSQARQRFVEAMDDDFNTAGGISVLFELVREINTRIQPTASAELAQGALDLLKELADVLGLLQGAFEAAADLDTEIQALVDARQAARKAKNFAEADRLRNQLNDMGIILEDTPQGVRWKRK
jgi:cysteinyl-tRNA synthetase